MRTFVTVLTVAVCVATAAPASSTPAAAKDGVIAARSRNTEVAASSSDKKGSTTGPAGRLNPNVRPPLGPRRPGTATGGKAATAPVTILTDAEVAGLKRTVTLNEATGEKLEFNGGMSPKRSLGKDEKWNEGDPIPFTVTCELMRVTTKKNGDEERKPVSCTVRFYVVDKQGVVIVSNSLPSEKLLPKTAVSESKAKAKAKAEFGFEGEVPKKGTYSIVMVTEYSGATLGFKETLGFSPPQPPKH